MAGLRESTTAVIVRGEAWSGTAASEPYEAGWATEAVIFLRTLKRDGDLSAATLRVQISPDGYNWVDEGTDIALPANNDAVTFARIAHFGNWLRIGGDLPDGGSCQLLATLHLKG